MEAVVARRAHVLLVQFVERTGLACQLFVIVGSCLLTFGKETTRGLISLRKNLRGMLDRLGHTLFVPLLAGQT